MDKRHANYQPWEKAFDRIVSPFEEFIHDETASGLILMACTLVALFLANGFLHDHYEHLLHTELAFSLGGWELRHTLHHWINDGLMALFFMVVGLEIKREIVTGELSDPRVATRDLISGVVNISAALRCTFVLGRINRRGMSGLISAPSRGTLPSRKSERS